MGHVAIIGSGVWGCAFDMHLANIGLKVKIWSRSQAEEFMASKQHPLLPRQFPDSIEFSNNVADVVAGASEVICMIPSSCFELFLDMIAPYVTEKQIILWGCKGWVKNSSSIYFHEVAKTRLGEHIKTAAISGPTFAAELAQALPTAVMIASNDNNVAEQVVHRFHGGSLRCYSGKSMATVQFCGVYKNIIAVAAGAADGLCLGANARAALITRGIAEMSRVAEALGLATEPLMGLAGLGDVMLSATSDLSRNRKLGLALGQGLTLEEIARQPGMSTLESVKNVAMMLEIATDQKIELPIAAAVAKVLSGEENVHAIVGEFLKRAPTAE